MIQNTKQPPDVAALEARFALRIGAQLNAAAEELPHDITERLRFARERALVRQLPEPAARPARVAEAPLLQTGSATLGLGTSDPREGRGWRWLATLLPAAGLLLGLALINEWQWNEQIHEAAEIDAVLLADDLPPQAYSDPGFAQFLKGAGTR